MKDYPDRPKSIGVQCLPGRKTELELKWAEDTWIRGGDHVKMVTRLEKCGLSEREREGYVWVEMKTGGSAAVSQGQQGTLKVIRTGRDKNESPLETLEAEGPVNILISDFCLQSYEQLNFLSLKPYLISICRGM